jgi:hypothetical protein
MDDDEYAQTKSDLANEFKRTKAGIWEVYEQIPVGKTGFNIPGIPNLSHNLDILNDLPFVWRMLKDVVKIKSCWYYLCLYIFVKVLSSLEPAVALWCVICALSSFAIVLMSSAQVHGSLPHHRSYL